MKQHLTFERLIQYDPGQPGITLDVSLSLSAASANFVLGLIDYEGKLLLSRYSL